MTERDELIVQLAERLKTLEAEKKSFEPIYNSAKAPIDRRKKEAEDFEKAATRWAEISYQFVGLPSHFARECEKLMPPVWKSARRYCVEHADMSGMDGPRREIFDAATGKLDRLFLIPGDLVKEVSGIRKDVGEKLSALEIDRAAEAVTAPPVQPGLRKSRPVSAGQFAAAIGGISLDSGIAAEIEVE